MHPDLEHLILLEKTEKEMARLNAEIAGLPRIVAEIEAKLNDARRRADEARQALKAQETKKRSLESDIQDLQQKISKFRDQSLDVKTNEQYRALMHEIEFAQKKIRENEDRILEGMESAESLEKNLKVAEADLKTETAAIEKEKEHARAVSAEDERQLAEWTQRRNEHRNKIASATLDEYDRVFKARKSGLAEAIGQKCAACFVMLRPQKWNEIKTNLQILHCDSCLRILYYDPAHEPMVEVKPVKPSKRKKAAAGEDAAAAQEEVPQELPSSAC